MIFGGKKNKLSISPGGTFEQAIFGKFEKKNLLGNKCAPSFPRAKKSAAVAVRIYIADLRMNDEEN